MLRAARDLIPILYVIGGLSGCALSPLETAHNAEDPGTWAAEPLRSPWTTARRDCVGFVMRYRARLLRAGLPPSAMSVATFDTPQGHHAALLVEYEGMVWKLDSLERRPVPWQPPDRWLHRDHTGRVLGINGCPIERKGGCA